MTIGRWLKGTTAALSSLVLSAVAYAQQTDANSGVTTTHTTTTYWYGQWYVWVGVALFVIVVIALTNRGSRQS